jgi:hypothetical protein
VLKLRSAEVGIEAGERKAGIAGFGVAVLSCGRSDGRNQAIVIAGDGEDGRRIIAKRVVKLVVVVVMFAEAITTSPRW